MSVIQLRAERAVVAPEEIVELPFEQLRRGQLAAILGCSAVLWCVVIAGGWSLMRLIS